MLCVQTSGQCVVADEGVGEVGAQEGEKAGVEVKGVGVEKVGEGGRAGVLLGERAVVLVAEVHSSTLSASPLHVHMRLNKRDGPVAKKVAG